MRVQYLSINVITVLFFTLLFVSFLATEKNREMRAWIALLGALLLWSLGSLFMRVQLYPGLHFWFDVSMLSLMSIPFLVYNYIYILSGSEDRAWRRFWFVLTVVLLALAANGFIIQPPQPVVNAKGFTVYAFRYDGRILIPIAFLLALVVATMRMFRSLVKQRGTWSPGLHELIFAWALIFVGNINHVMPWSDFPFDKICGVLFAILMLISMHKRRLFSTRLIASGGILFIASSAVFVTAGAYLLHPLIGYLSRDSVHFVSAEVEAFLILSILMVVAIFAFRHIVGVLFSDEEYKNNRIREYTDTVSRTLDMETILNETVQVVRTELNTPKVCICLLQDGVFTPVCSSDPEFYAGLGISSDHPITECFTRGENNLLLRDLEREPMYEKVSEADREMFAEYGVSCISAMKDGDKLVGLLLLSPKNSHNGLRYGDYAFINTVGAVATIAIKNAVLYKQVAEREKLFSDMTKFIPNVILIAEDEADEFCFVSANTEPVLGVPPEYFSNRTARQALAMLVGDDRRDELLDLAVSSGKKGVRCDVPLLRRTDHKEITVHLELLPIYTGDTITHRVCLMNDVSDEVESRNLLRRSVELAQRSNDAKTEFMSHMSHEIRTPISSIEGLTYLSRGIVNEEKQPELSGYIGQIGSISHYLIGMLNDIMDMSRIETKGFELQSKGFDLTALVNDTFAVFKPYMQLKGVHSRLHIDLQQSSVVGDEISLRRILNNLLSNAMKFTHDGGEVSLTVSQRTVSEHTAVVRFVICDSGIGMSKEFLEHIFEPYAQENRESIGNAQGSGLGMAICKNLVDMQNGSIKVESEPGEGSCFTVDIPYKLAESEKKNEKREYDDNELSGRRVLIVDDVSINVAIIRKMLEKKGMLVESAGNGQEALDKFESKPNAWYDCILMDIQMPVMDGIEAARRIRTSPKPYAPYVPIVALSADMFSNNAYSGFDDFILKPFDAGDIYGKIAAQF